VAVLNKQQVYSFDQAIILLNFGEEHRVYKETSIHEHSSRSHTIFRLYIESWPKNHPVHKRYSMLNLVDLAGSERLNEFDSGASKAESSHMGETGYINKSLFVLSNVINKLAEGKARWAHIPYRDSKLTRILQMALGGNSLTAIICTISPASINYYQTLSTLRFATRAKIVKNKPTVNEITGASDSDPNGDALAL
jgi:Kinesin motor domain